MTENHQNLRKLIFANDKNSNEKEETRAEPLGSEVETSGAPSNNNFGKQNLLNFITFFIFVLI